MSKRARLASFARHPPWWVILFAAACANFIAAKLTTLVPIEGGPGNIQSVMWAPAGIAFAFAWYFGRTGVIGSYLGTALFVFGHYGHPLFSLLAAIGHSLPTAYAAWQLRRNGITDAFASPRNILQFIVFGVVIAPLLSSAFGVLLPLLDPSTQLHWGLTAWFALWANEAVGVLVIAPALLKLDDWRQLSRHSRIELIGLILGILIFWSQVYLAIPQTLTSPLTVLTTPCLILMAFRYPFGVVAGISLMLSVIGLISLTHHPYGSDTHAFFFSLIYFATLGLSNIAVGAGSAVLRNTMQRLSASEELLRGMFEQAAVGLLLYDLKTNQRTCNPKFSEMLGYPMEKITDGDLRSISFPDEHKITEDYMLKIQSGEIDSFNQEKRYIRQDGNVIWTSLTVSIQRDKSGAGNLVISIFEDITPRKHIEEKLRNSEQRFRITFEQAAVGVALLDRDSNWLQVNQTFCDIVGYTRDELLQQRYGKLLAPEDLEHTAQSITELRRGGTSQIQLDHRYMRKNGDVIWVNSQFSVARNAAGDIDYQIAVINDITERKRAEAEIERFALYDYLTALPNRRLFGDRLRTAVMAAKRSARFGAVIYIDLDNFKQLNDTHGHNTGDDFLKMVAHRLQRNLREEDTVARLGGDEFVILLQNVSDSLPETAIATAAIAEKIQSALSEPFVLPSGIEHVGTSSLGITLFPKDAESAEDLLKEADIAMYRVKETQRNAMRFYEPAMKAAVDSRLALERALRRALHDNEFELYLQPQYDAARTMVSCEALLRWPQPNGGFISPNEFIPLAEETGLIVPLGEWVLRRAGNLAHALEFAGYTISISINVSPRQFNEANFVERVRTILWETGADSGRIMLEITEGVVVADFDDVRTKMLALRQMGIRLSIDDFGTGHSSLAYLKLLPLHELKIDRAFVCSLPDDANDVVIVEAVLSVARHLQLEVVAEGVETEAQFEFLKQRGCQRFQGYLLARPAPPHQHFPELSRAPEPTAPD